MLSDKKIYFLIIVFSASLLGFPRDSNSRMGVRVKGIIVTYSNKTVKLRHNKKTVHLRKDKLSHNQRSMLEPYVGREILWVVPKEAIKK